MRATDLRLLSRRALWALCVLAPIAITVAIYWPGMHGPVLLDDVPNLLPVSGWLTGQYDWRRVVFGNHSGMLGRSVSMATFLLDAVVTGSMATSTFKPTNLVIHVLCGLAVLWLALQVFRRWEPTREHARWAALALMGAWLWLPLNVDTVLYIVQRMAQLAALFMLLALGCYMKARQQITCGLRRGHVFLWLGVPALTVLAVLSKENGVLALPLALVLECFLFRDMYRRRPASVKLFFALTVGLPTIIGTTWIIVDPAFIASGYAGRSFTLTERLLTEPRVLWSYVQTLLVPLGSRMGFFQDNFPVSTGPLQPWTTLPALAGWVALAIVSWLWRRRNPLFAAGVFFFIVGQSLESGPFALELYFEHRNYLPSFGALLAVAGLLTWAWQSASSPTRAFRRVCIMLLASVLGLYAAATWSHVQSWRSERTFLYAQNVYNPTSPRFRSYIVALALEHHDLPATLTFINIAERDVPPDQRPTMTLWRFLAYCSAKVAPPAELYDQLARRAHGRIGVTAERALGFLADDAEAKCPGLDVPRLATAIGHWLDTTQTPVTSEAVWQSRASLARTVAADRRLAEARDIMHRAWIDSRYNSDVGILLFQLDGSLGDVKACHEVLAKLTEQQGQGDLLLDRAVARFSRALATNEIGNTNGPAGKKDQP